MITQINGGENAHPEVRIVQIYHKKPKKSTSDSYEAANSSFLNNWYDSPTSPRFGISKPKPKLDVIQSCKYWNVKPSDAFVWEWFVESFIFLDFYEIFLTISFMIDLKFH